eukprot:sb/3474880/
MPGTDRHKTTNQNSLFRSHDWISANQGPVFPDSVGAWFMPILTNDYKCFLCPPVSTQVVIIPSMGVCSLPDLDTLQPLDGSSRTPLHSNVDCIWVLAEGGGPGMSLHLIGLRNQIPHHTPNTCNKKYWFLIG